MTTESDGASSPSVKQLQDQLELYINEQAADLAVFRVTLQTFLLQLSATRPRPDELIQDIHRRVVDALNRTNAGADNALSQEKAKQLTLMRADLFFQELLDTVQLVGSSGESKAPN